MSAENVQILLITVIVTLTGLLVFIGIQVILILKETHSVAKRLNREQKNDISFTKDDIDNGKIENQDGEFPTHIASLQEKGRRVFVREGRPLA